MPRYFDREEPFDPSRLVVAFRCAWSEDCGVRFLKQPKDGVDPQASPPEPVWCSTCGEMKLDTKPQIQMGLI